MADLLIVEDEVVLARSIARSLSNRGHLVTVSGTLQAGEQAFEEQHPDLALLDMELPDGSGLDLLARWMARDPQARVLVMTAYAGTEHAERARKLGARGCLHKPMDLDDLATAVMAALGEG